MWTNRKVFTDLGMEPPKDINELLALAPALQEAGIQPLSLAQGWPVGLMVNDILVAQAGVENFVKVYKDRDIGIAGGIDHDLAEDRLPAFLALADHALDRAILDRKATRRLFVGFPTAKILAVEKGFFPGDSEGAGEKTDETVDDDFHNK